MKFFSLYFDWLQRDNPTGKPDQLPELTRDFETSVPGLYCIGDLTGIPLIKLAAESGYKFIQRLVQDSSFVSRYMEDGAYDLIIIGAGPSGVSASLNASRHGLNHLLIESSQVYNTIVNFPVGKPIFVTPAEPPMKSDLVFHDGTKETLLEELRNAIEKRDLPLLENETVKRIVKEQKVFVVETDKGKYRASRVVVAIGRNGNARKLGVPGENLPKVFTRLIDPTDFVDRDIMVVGGGDSALETAIALARNGNRVSFSYRKDQLSRPKEQNIAAFEELVQQGKITPYFGSQVLKITEDAVLLQTKDGEKRILNDNVFVLIGSEFPIVFFQRSNIRMAGEKKFSDWVKAIALILFASVLYFGKKAPITSVSKISEFIRLPEVLWQYSWPEMLTGICAWLSLLTLIPCIVYLIFHFFANSGRYFMSGWSIFKYSYYSIMLFLFCWLYIAFKLRNQHVLFTDMGVWYTAIYSLTILIFGLRRMYVNPTGYIKRQTLVLMAIQVIPLFILPVFVLPWLDRQGLISDVLMDQVFPEKSYWRAYGFILAWPLFIHNLANGSPSLFWLIFGLVQTFLIIPWLVYRWGKGSYCGWICSCGALAETLGDEYRTEAPHGPVVKRLENVGQVILWFAALVTILAGVSSTASMTVSEIAFNIYNILVDIIFAGVLGVGVYFFMSGRIWCRFLCPLAALMHIYARFSVYRIFADKKRCISCNVCTRVCHMGIDVMNFANKGIPMNDVECVRCSACIISCPMNVLSFGRLDKADPDNQRYKQRKPLFTPSWQSGLSQDDIEALLKVQNNKK